MGYLTRALVGDAGVEIDIGVELALDGVIIAERDFFRTHGQFHPRVVAILLHNAIFMDNKRTAQDIYAAFDRRDVPAILSHLREDIEWEYGMADNDVPWFQKRKGRAAVPSFFQAMGGIDLQNFKPKMLLEKVTTREADS